MDCKPWNKEQGLHYSSPAHGGWGVVRVAMLVPESQVLFVCPSGCGRHGALGAIETRNKNRVAYLCIDEADIVSGRYEEMVPQAVEEMINRLDSKPKAFFIFVSCLDDLLGTDYEETLESLCTIHKIPFRICHMNPISLDSKLPPPVNVQKNIYSLLEAKKEKADAVNILGAFAPLDKDSEIFSFLKECGIKKVNHISEFSTFEGFEKMAEAKLNLVLRPEALAAAKDMEKNLGIPFCFVPVSYNLSTIEQQYRIIAEATGSSLDLSNHKREASEQIEAAKNIIGDMPISIDAGATCRPYDLAAALISYGFNVIGVYADKLPEFEAEVFTWLKKHAPQVKYYQTEHHTWVNERSDNQVDEISIGFNAGYLTGSSKTLSLAFDEGMFGYRGIIKLMTMMTEAFEQSSDLKTKIEEYGLVV